MLRRPVHYNMFIEGKDAMKRFFCVLLALMMVFAAAASRAEGYLVLPADTVRIEDEAFAGDMSLDAVVIPEGTEHIGARAFAESGVSKVSFPGTLTFIDDSAFEGCGTIEYTAPEGSYARGWCEIHFASIKDTDISCFDYGPCEDGMAITGYFGPDTQLVIPTEIEWVPVTEIYEYAFDYEAIESVYLRGTVKRIGSGAFYDCTSLTSVTLCEGIMYIGTDCFSYCEYLESVSLPSTLETLGDSAFANCYSVKEIDIPGGVGEVSTKLLEGCTSLEKVTLGEGIMRICDNAFQGCESLRELHVPSSCEVMADNLFHLCSDICLSEMTIYGYAGSCAESFAAENGIRFVLEAAAE